MLSLQYSSMIKCIFILFSLFLLGSCNEYQFDNCLLHSRSDNVIIDLSGELESDSWSAIGSDMLPNSTYYFSMCPKKHSKCPPNSYFCVKLNGTIIDLGSTYNGTSVGEGGEDGLYMSLKSEHGSGKVYLHCDPGKADPVLSSISIENKDRRQYFDYLITWSSVTNCPLKHFSVKESCILYTHSRSYDLRPLRKSHRVSAADKDYIINICEVVDPKCPSFVCEVGNNVHPKPITSVFELSYLENRGLRFTYLISTGGKIVIDLHCSPDQGDYKLDLVSNNEDDLFFSIKTPLVCEFHPMNCLLHDQDKNIAYDLNRPKLHDQDKNIAYDLNQLNKMIDNYDWKLENGKRLLLNVCGPLNYIPQVPCADGIQNYGCIVDSDNRTEILLTLGNVTVIGPGHIAMIYNSKNPKKNNLSLNITFKCFKDVSVSPTLSTSDASYNIYWKTYAACPLKYSIGKECEVENLYNKSKVNLMPLYNRKKDYFIMNGNESFRINVCGLLTQSCSRNRNAAVCFKNSNGTEIAIGETGAFEPNFVDGQFIFNLEGQPCHKNATKSRVKIIMECELASPAASNYFPELFPNPKENECMYYFYWKTPLVCGSVASSNCTFSNEDVQYNLSSLINLKENYVINYNDSDIVLNICHSLIPGHRIHCHELSGACLKNHSINSILSSAYDNHENNHNLGFISGKEDFDIIGDKIRLYYRNGGVCTSSTEESVYSTTIDFICDKTASHTEPKLVSVKDCEYNISFTTSAACPTYKSKGACSINVANKTFDFSSFMGKDYEVDINSKGPLNYKITIGICSPVDITGCSMKSGSCLTEVVGGVITENLGNYNSKLQYVNESLLLVYEATDCKSTIIQFSCGPESSRPVLIKRNNCTTIISWSTKLACLDDITLNEMKCCQGIEDLCEKLNETYEVEVEKENAFINICKPLLPRWGLMCPSESVSCLAKNESLDSFSSEKSLGSFMMPPVLLDEKTAILKYFDGSVCHKDPVIRYSTSITFICDENADVGRLKLVNISDDCQYDFKWATSLMCHEKCKLPNVLQQFQNRNTIILSKNGMDLSPYMLNLCQVSPMCGSHICKRDSTSKWQSFADVNSNETVKVTDLKTTIFYKYLSNYKSKDSCGSQVDLICDNNDRGPGRPKLIEERDCFIHVVWESNLACFSEKNTASSSNIAVWCFFSIAILLFVVIVAIVLKYNRQTIVESCLNRTGYRRSEVDTELQSLTSEEKRLEEEMLFILKTR